MIGAQHARVIQTTNLPELETFIVCPSRSVPVPTGVDLADLSDPGRIYMLVRCGACGGDHLWSGIDAVLPLLCETATTGLHECASDCPQARYTAGRAPSVPDIRGVSGFRAMT